MAGLSSCTSPLHASSLSQCRFAHQVRPYINQRRCLPDSNRPLFVPFPFFVLPCGWRLPTFLEDLRPALAVRGLFSASSAGERPGDDPAPRLGSLSPPHPPLSPGPRAPATYFPGPACPVKFCAITCSFSPATVLP